MYDDYDYEEPEMPEYAEKIKEIIDAEVQARFKSKVKDYDALREAQKEYNKKVQDLKEENRKAQREAEDAKWKLETAEKKFKKDLQQARVSGFTDFIGKWNTATSAYVVQYKEVKPTCPICKGKFALTITIDGAEAYMPCPLCNPNGYWERGRSQSALPEKRRYFINDQYLKYNPVRVYVEEGKLRICTADSWGSKIYLDGENAFTNEADAKTYAELKNKESDDRMAETLSHMIAEKHLEKYLTEE